MDLDSYAIYKGISLVAQIVKNLPVIQETPVRSLGQENPLEKGMATHSSILTWRIPWTEEAGGVQSMGSKVKVKVTQLYLTLYDPMDYTVHGTLQVRILGYVATPFSRGIFLTQELNWGLLHYRQILYHLSHQGNAFVYGIRIQVHSLVCEHSIMPSLFVRKTILSSF